MSSVVRPLTGAIFSSLMVAVLAISAMPAAAAKKQPAPRAVVERSASGTIIQPTTTIIPDGNGHSRVIIIPRRRSYLDTGTEVSVGDRHFRDYAFPPSGDPGRVGFWFYGFDQTGSNGLPLPRPFDIPGFNPAIP